MQTIRFEWGYLGRYLVYYRSIRVAALIKNNKNKWHLTFVDPSFNWGDETFNSLKEAKRFIRINLNKYYVAERDFRKMIEIGTARVIKALEALENLDLVSQPEKSDVDSQK